MYLKLQAYHQKSVVNQQCLKLAAKYFGPYKVIEQIKVVAYKLQLPLSAKIHLVFHVSQLKQHIGKVVVTNIGKALAQSQLLLLDIDGVLAKEPMAILDRRMNKRKGKL